MRSALVLSFTQKRPDTTMNLPKSDPSDANSRMPRFIEVDADDMDCLLGILAIYTSAINRALNLECYNITENVH